MHPDLHIAPPVCPADRIQIKLYKYPKAINQVE